MNQPYLIPLNARQRSPAVGLAVALSVSHHFRGRYGAGSPSPFEDRDVLLLRPGHRATAPRPAGPWGRQEPVSIPRKQNPQQTQQVGQVGSPTGSYSDERDERDGPDDANGDEDGHSLTQLDDQQSPAAQAAEDNQSGGEGQQLLLCPAQEGLSCGFAQVTHQQQEERGTGEHSGANQIESDAEKGTYKDDNWRSAVARCKKHIQSAARREMKYGAVQVAAISAAAAAACIPVDQSEQQSESNRDAGNRKHRRHCSASPCHGNSQTRLAPCVLAQRGNTCLHVAAALQRRPRAFVMSTTQ